MLSPTSWWIAVEPIDLRRGMDGLLTAIAMQFAETFKRFVDVRLAIAEVGTEADVYRNRRRHPRGSGGPGPFTSLDSRFRGNDTIV